MWFITSIFANLLGRPSRTLLTLSGIAIAVAAVVSLLGIVRGFERSLSDLYRGRGIDIVVQQGGRLQMISSVLPQSLGESIAQVDGVWQVHPVLFEGLSLIPDDMVGVVVQGWEPDSPAVQQLNYIRGARLESPTARQAVVGNRLAEALSVTVGGTIDLIEGESFEVIGVFDAPNVFDSGSLVVPLQALQELMLRDDEVTMFAVVGRDQSLDELRELAKRIEGSGGKLEATVAEDVAQRSAEIRVARAFAWMTSMIALMIGAVGMLNTMMMAVFERTREIAMLRALGWSRRRVLSMILGESLLLSLVGAVVGIGLAWLVVQGLTQSPAAGRVVAGEISREVMVQGLAIAIALGALGGLYPAWKAARLSPVEGLRHD